MCYYLLFSCSFINNLSEKFVPIRGRRTDGTLQCNTARRSDHDRRQSRCMVVMHTVPTNNSACTWPLEKVATPENSADMGC